MKITQLEEINQSGHNNNPVLVKLKCNAVHRLDLYVSGQKKEMQLGSTKRNYITGEHQSQ
jgi:hypothetical protein